MAALANSKHEHFAQAIAKGVSASKAYVSAGYSPKGAKQSAARMRTNADLRSRIRELQATLAAGVVDVEIRKRSARVQVLQKRLDRMLALSAARALEYADNLQGATGVGWSPRRSRCETPNAFIEKTSPAPRGTVSLPFAVSVADLAADSRSGDRGQPDSKGAM